MDFFSEQLQQALGDIIKHGILSIKELKERIFKCLVQLPQSESLYILENFLHADLSAVTNREQYLYESFIDHIAPTRTNVSNLLTVQAGSSDAADRQKIESLLQRTGCSLIVSAEQRKYAGPPPDWNGPQPVRIGLKKSPQVLISNLKNNIYEDRLIPELEKIGRIYQLVINIINGVPSGEAIVDFCHLEHAEIFVKTYNSKEFCGSTVFVFFTDDLNKVYLVGVPRRMAEIQVERELLRIFPDALDVETLGFTMENNIRRDRIASVEFKSYIEASNAKRLLETGKALLFGLHIKKCEWKAPSTSEIESGGSKSIIINIEKSNLTQEQIKTYFEAFGKINTFIKNNVQVTIEYESPVSAKTASVNGYCMIDNQRVEVKRSESKLPQVVTSKPVVSIKPPAPNQKFIEKKRELTMIKPKNYEKKFSEPYKSNYQSNYRRNNYSNENITNVNASNTGRNNYKDNPVMLDSSYNRFDNNSFNNFCHVDNYRENYQDDYRQDNRLSRQDYSYESEEYYRDQNRGIVKNLTGDFSNPQDDSAFDISKYGRPGSYSYSQPSQIPLQQPKHNLPSPITHFQQGYSNYEKQIVRSNKSYDYEPMIHDWSQNPVYETGTYGQFKTPPMHSTFQKGEKMPQEQKYFDHSMQRTIAPAQKLNSYISTPMQPQRPMSQFGYRSNNNPYQASYQNRF